MSVDLDRLLGDTAGEPNAPIDVDGLWRRGRRRRRARHAVAGGTAALVLVVGGLGVTNLLTGVTGVDVQPLSPEPAPTTDPAPAPTDDPDTAAGPNAPSRDTADDDTPSPERSPSGGTDDEVEREPRREEVSPPVVVEEEGERDAAGDPVWTPDPAALADPCAGHQDRTGEAFVEVVSPVPAQDVGDAVDLVGCANVYEATVLYRFRAENGPEVGEPGFVTATCGSGCVGEFRETVALPEGFQRGSLEVYWEDAADGSARSVQVIPIHR
ncbi:Gmad2 immunoglobulin-like domain-containing protein [Egicoccus sp. AB-alg2]|uniref:Gmad2 immunoglobulin-like domain-containing protein n=1 Tax=Egicoccus sp. AB-alg2 TaxID=3242693 RepID=UPI00359F02DD